MREMCIMRATKMYQKKKTASVKGVAVIGKLASSRSWQIHDYDNEKPIKSTNLERWEVGLEKFAQSVGWKNYCSLLCRKK